MKADSTPIVAVASLLLHGGLLAAVFSGVAANRKAVPERPHEERIAMRLLPSIQQAPALPPVSRREKAPDKPPPQKVPPRARTETPAREAVVPVPSQATAAAPAVELSAAAADAPPGKASPPAAATPVAAASPAPVRTGPSVGASYIAAETARWYPPLSRRYQEQGTVLLLIYVSLHGRSEKVELKKSSGYPLLDEAAIGLAKSLTYQPAMVNGTPVSEWVELPVTFRLRNS